MSIVNVCEQYQQNLNAALSQTDWSGLYQLADDLINCWQHRKQVFICGNGGSAGNAIHLTNDFVYGIAKQTGGGIKAVALTANQSVVTCLANDLGYDDIFSEQIALFGETDDVLIVLSGSGNSPNVVKAIRAAQQKGIKVYALVGYSGGQSKQLADVSIHFPVNDMQIAEDMQTLAGHMLMQYLYSQRHLITHP